ncbi:hypothetical protein KYC5002_26810 [Archangium violaceum]|uniref:hypothetical protein n=1 Tax=Archangium violaceum TaxID=83451 RepID=UPI002B311C37|nr:hypothetical protein KYC5002_26810 [Archangium gephyra]
MKSLVTTRELCAFLLRPVHRVVGEVSRSLEAGLAEPEVRSEHVDVEVTTPVAAWDGPGSELAPEPAPLAPHAATVSSPPPHTGGHVPSRRAEEPGALPGSGVTPSPRATPRTMVSLGDAASSREMAREEHSPGVRARSAPSERRPLRVLSLAASTGVRPVGGAGEQAGGGVAFRPLGPSVIRSERAGEPAAPVTASPAVASAEMSTQARPSAQPEVAAHPPRSVVALPLALTAPPHVERVTARASSTPLEAPAASGAFVPTPVRPDAPAALGAPRVPAAPSSRPGSRLVFQPGPQVSPPPSCTSAAPSEATRAWQPPPSRATTEAAERVSSVMAPVWSEAQRVNGSSSSPAPSSSARASGAPSASPATEARNTFNVNVHLDSGAGDTGTRREELEEALVDILRETARRHGLEV